ncbi:MAG TPA: xanthine dehydrogenase family protein molybdopterin-binding subunit [Acetobacteraceae bacterium]|nr:xanthine dehydrogenase family protein molybdopterin-binding subunit [Acetobacteraceae bacterium]
MEPTYTGRREDRRLVTGAGMYAADWDRPGVLHAAFLRADRAHARIVSSDVSAAQAAPGVCAVLTGADMQSAGYSRGLPLMPLGRGEPLKAIAAPALALDCVRYVGEPVAIVVADSPHAAQDACELIRIDYASLPPVVGGAAALAQGAPLLHPEIPGNLCYETDYGDSVATQAAFAAARHVVRLEQVSGRVVGNPMEPQAAMAAWDGDILELWSPSQGMTSVRDSLAALVGLPPDRLRVHARDVGGAFGIRGGAYPEYAALALAARQIGRPVKWIASRSETFLTDYHARAVSMVAELALDADGCFLAIRHDWICDIGAYPSAAGPFTNTFNAALMATGAYLIPAVHGRTRLAVTNSVPITAYRGAGRPDMAYAVERLVDEAAAQTGIDRIALRRRNLIPRDRFPYAIATAPFPAAYDSADFDALLDVALAESKWDTFPARRAAAARRGRLRGIGCALFIEPAGGVAPSDDVALTFEPNGSILLHEVAIASGQGHETVLPEIVGRALEIDPLRITLLAGRQDGPTLNGAGAFGSRSMMSQGAGSATAAAEVLRKGKELASETLEAAPADIRYAEGDFIVDGTDRRVGLAELARLHPGGLDTTVAYPAPKAFPSGAHVAEVEIDPETGTTEIVGYVSIDDCGVVLNQTLLAGQVLGGLVQGLGQVFGELCVYTEDGQIVTASFMDYTMPHADLLPQVTIKTVLVPSPTNTLGVKGVGEAGTVGSLPTAMNAVMDALRTQGVAHLDMPASAQRVWQALQDARRRRRPVESAV